MLRTKVLVIGGGPAGSTAARVLAERGIETVLLERNFSSLKPCGGGVPSAVFAAFGIPEHIIRRHVNTVKVVAPSGEMLRIGLARDSIAMVERKDFDHCLRSAAEKKGARLLEAEFTHLSGTGKAVTAEVVREGKMTQIRADFLIAADGINSRVRTALKIKAAPSLCTLSGDVPGDGTDCCEFWFGSSHAPRCYSWVFPRNGSMSVGTGTFRQRGIQDFWRAFALRRGFAADSPRRGYRVPLWNGDLYQVGNILFAGDAAGQVMPFTFEGIYYSMKAGAMAAEALAAGRPAAYRKLWEDSFRKKFLLMRSLWKFCTRDDVRLEKVVRLHRDPEVQTISINLWLCKDSGGGTLRSYMKIIKDLLL